MSYQLEPIPRSRALVPFAGVVGSEPLKPLGEAIEAPTAPRRKGWGLIAMAFVAVLATADIWHPLGTWRNVAVPTETYQDCISRPVMGPATYARQLRRCDEAKRRGFLLADVDWEKELARLCARWPADCRR